MNLFNVFGLLAQTNQIQWDMPRIGNVAIPPAASTVAREVDFWFYFIFWVSLFFFVGMMAFMFYFIVRYKRQRGVRSQPSPTHNTPLELTWSILPSILLVVMFWGGFKGYMDMRVAPENALRLNVAAQQWNWEFGYPNGHTDNELHVPANVPVELTMESKDVLHSFYVPAFRVKQDVVPGRYTKIWFQSDKPGSYVILCTEYCGKSHSDMLAKCVVHPSLKDYEEWLSGADPLSRKNLSDEEWQAFQANPEQFIAQNPAKKLKRPDEMGRDIYTKRGCAQCHSLDGKAGVGPSFKGIWGHDQPLRDGGSVKVDENYVRESILEPGAKIAAGYQNQMPKLAIKDREITMLIAFIRSLGEEKK